RQLPLQGEKRYVRNLAFAPDGQTLVACQYKGFLQFWEAASGKELRTVQLQGPAPLNQNFVYFYQLYVSPDLKNVSTLERVLGQGRESTRLAYWETTTGNLVRAHALFPQELKEGAPSSDGKAVALPLNDGLTLVEAATGVVRFRIAGTPNGGPI